MHCVLQHNISQLPQHKEYSVLRPHLN